jgi:hypothetical protein
MRIECKFSSSVNDESCSGGMNEEDDDNEENEQTDRN